MAECHPLCDPTEGVHAPGCQNDQRPLPGPLYVAWIPVGTGQIQDEGAIVGTEFICRVKAEQWLRADPEHITTVKIAAIPSRNVCDARLELGDEITIDAEF